MTTVYRVNVDARRDPEGSFHTFGYYDTLEEAKAAVPVIRRKYPKTTSVVIDRIDIETVHTDRGEGA